MVSSSWPDWKSFSLCHTAPRFSPQLALPNGDVAHCHGYIMGTLWKDCLGQKWTGIRVFVVDALLTLGGSDKCYNFLFSPDSLTDRKARPGKFEHMITASRNSAYNDVKFPPSRSENSVEIYVLPSSRRGIDLRQQSTPRSGSHRGRPHAKVSLCPKMSCLARNLTNINFFSRHLNGGGILGGDEST